MKAVDIRVIGKTEIDMNTLTDVAREKANNLFLDYEELGSRHDVLKKWYWEDYNPFEYKGSNAEMYYGQIKEVLNAMDRIEIELIQLAKNPDSYKGATFGKIKYYTGKFIESKWLDLALVGAWGTAYVTSCMTKDIGLAVVSAYWTIEYALKFNIKRYVEKVVM